MHDVSGIRFVIPQSVFDETVSRPETIRRFELNAVRLKQAVAEGWIELVKPDQTTTEYMSKLADLCNKSFFSSERSLELLQKGELEAMAVFKQLSADGLAIDERTCRMILEDPFRLQSLIGKRNDQRITVDEKRLSELTTFLGKPLVVRSCDLLALAYKQKLFPDDLVQSKQGLEAALWSVKFTGCAVSGSEIEDYLKTV